jgi:heterodisulfide reductase subunit A
MSQKTNNVKRGSVLIAGGGIGGMQAALDLADSGFKVHMVQRESSIGGTMVMLDKTFPTGDCSMCMISPKMVEVGRHPNIKLHTLAEVAGVEGVPGDFTVTVKQQPRYVDAEKCTGCGACEQKCPKKVPSEFEQGLAVRKAIYTILPQAVPLTRVIDPVNCIYLTKGKCKACEKFCPTGAINWDDKEKFYDLKVGAVILSPGLARYNPRVRGELGFGRWPNVVTSIQFERILSASGPFRGEVKRPSDGKHPHKVAWIQCVGSRDPRNANPWCSSVCCMYATKQAIIAKEHDRNVTPTIFFMEMRAFGKDFDKYVDRAQKEFGVSYKRAMISDIKEEAGTGNLILRYAKEDGQLVDEIFDMVVLSIGFQPHEDVKEFAGVFGIDLNHHQFAKTTAFTPVETSRPGVYVTGTFQGPKDIPETVAQGSAVAGRSMALLGEARGTEIVKEELPPEKDVTGQEPRIGVFVCHCGINIASTVDVKKVAAEMGKMDNVVHSEDLMYACAPDGQTKIKQLINDHQLNRIIVASCTPRTHAPLFQETIREAGLNKYLFELADIREQCSWCHMGQNEVATQKATQIVRMNVAKSRLLQPVQTDSVPVTPAALVIGGGVAGMTTAISLGDQGFDVHIVEKEKELGGLARNVYRTLDGSDVQSFIKQKIADAENHPRITVHKGAEVASTTGFIGNFKTTLTNEDVFDHGAIVVATGGMEYQPQEYDFGQTDRVITQRTLEKQIAEGLNPGRKHYAMIQCIGSREEPNNYCSRICCQDAIKNAIAIKEKSPDAQVTILYRDIRTYGLREDYYQKARELGVLFVRFVPERKPDVNVKGAKIKIKTFDYVMNREIAIYPDVLVLSTGLRPHPATPKISKQYKLTLNPDGYFLEAHVKLRPVDFPSEGIYVAGLAHAPKNLDETLSQSLAAAGRAGVLLSHDRLGVSGIISKHNRNICMSCLACFRLCPFGSPFIDEDGKISHNEVLCTGCGICAGICPAKAFQVNSFRDDQIIAMIDAATEDIVSGVTAQA